MMKKALALTFLFFLLSGLRIAAHAQGAEGPLGEESIRAIVAGAPSEAERPGEDALVLFEGTYIRFAGGKAEKRVQRLTKLFTEYAIEELGDPRISFDRSRQELVIHASLTYLPDGSIVDTPEEEKHGYSGYNEVTPDGLDRSVDHLDIREMVVTRVGLVRGATILLDYTIRDTAPGALPYQTVLFACGEWPALSKEVVVEGLNAEAVNPANALHTLPEPSGQAKKTWRLSNVPAAPHGAAHDGDQLPYIVLSEAGKWEEMVGRFGLRMEEAVKESDGLLPVLEDLEKDRPFLSKREALEKCAKMIRDRTALVDYEPWVFTPAPRDVATVLGRSNATPQERAALLLACCRQMEIDADLLLPSRWKSLSDEVGALEALSTPWIRAQCDEGLLWWADPVEGVVRARPDLVPGLPCFVWDRRGVERVRIAPERSRVDFSLFWDLESGEAKAECFLSGPVTAGLDLERPEPLLQEWVEGWCDSARVEECRLLSAGPGGIHFVVDVSAPMPAADERGRALLRLPTPLVDLAELGPEGMDAAQSEIEETLFFDAPLELHARWSVHPGDGHTLLPGRTESAEWGRASFAVTREETGERVVVDCSLALGEEPVSPERYAAYRGFHLRMTDDRILRVVLEEK